MIKNKGDLVTFYSYKERSMKTEILAILRDQKDYISGQQISEDLGVTRTTVWKIINQLRAEGYHIDSITNKGYRLLEAPDIVTSDEIKSVLKTGCFGAEVYDYKEVTSTNKLAKIKAAEGAKEGTLLIAETQTAGRGRLGKVWDSPEGTGIWMSIILRPPILPQDVSGITLIAGLAICKGIREITNLPAYIKWPNDVIINGRKVCGILTEMSAEMERVNYVIVGIGINVNTKNIPQDLQEIATSLSIEGEKKYSRKDIVAATLTSFEKYYKEYLSDESLSPLLDRYKDLCITLKSKVQIIGKDETYQATPVDIDKTGALIVDKKDGKREIITSGEVSVRGVYGYV